MPTGREKWWEHSGTSGPTSPVFELPDSALLIKNISTQLKSGTLPLFEVPENIMRTLFILNNPDFKYEDIAAQIERSPAMTGEILKLINSPLINRGQKVYDLWAALPLLGRTRIKSFLYMYAAQMNAQKIPLFKQLCQDIIEHSYTVALVASYLSQLYYPEPDTAFLAGLFHDIGKLAILKAIANTCNLPEDDSLKITEESCALIFPQLHEKAGLHIALHWSMSDTVKAAILHHHDRRIDYRCYQDPEMAENLINLISLSDTIARVLGRGRAIGPTNIFEDPAAKALHLVDNWATREHLKMIPAMLDGKFEG